MCLFFCFILFGDHLDLHVLPHSFPTLRSSDLSWVWQFRLFDIGYQWYWFAVAFVIDDVAYYVFHRSAHRVRWFWASHVIHHSSQHYNLSTALRQTWTGFFSLSFIFRLPLFLIGFPPPLVFFVAGLNQIGSAHV